MCLLASALVILIDRGRSLDSSHWKSADGISAFCDGQSADHMVSAIVRIGSIGIMR